MRITLNTIYRHCFQLEAQMQEDLRDKLLMCHCVMCVVDCRLYGSKVVAWACHRCLCPSPLKTVPRSYQQSCKNLYIALFVWFVWLIGSWFLSSIADGIYTLELWLSSLTIIWAWLGNRCSQLPTTRIIREWVSTIWRKCIRLFLVRQELKSQDWNLN